MNKYIKDKNWIETIRERLCIGIKHYGIDSDFVTEYINTGAVDKDVIERLFEKWGIYTRSEKLKMLLS